MIARHLGMSIWTARTHVRHIFAKLDVQNRTALAFLLTQRRLMSGQAGVRVIDPAGVRLAVDVGGASGDLLHELMKVNPRLAGIVFDLPLVTSDARAAGAR